ncbi:flagellar outer dynein arm-docking complex protein 1 [Histomonas meleagridis]|uniref:flagellar outer dynein arm-docking complex protein 1 n=1 Tax=Histomonas meleagridis TaxID=135588 RepID=UPI00355A2BD5|nr:flagellar outer dynein arm-docking complex protein 1 [Histomonas meleagridis]
MENPAEVQEIRNKLRMMKFPQDEILNTVRKQQRAIHKQKQANETIRTEITQYEAQINKINQSIEKYKTDEELQRLQTLKKNLSNKLSVLNNDLAVEESKRKKLEEDVSKANSKTGGLFQQTHENEEIQARLRTMENRLDKALVRYNNNLTKLGELRKEIDEYRKEKNTFQHIIKKAEIERERNDQEMARLISDSNEAYSDRDRMKMDLAELKQKEKESIQNYETDLLLINQQIEGQRITQNHPRDQQQQIPSMSSQLSSQTDQQEELVQQTEQLYTSNQRVFDLLGVKNIEELFSESEQLEREKLFII